MKIHHIGYLVKKIEKAINTFLDLVQISLERSVSFITDGLSITV